MKTQIFILTQLMACMISYSQWTTVDVGNSSEITLFQHSGTSSPVPFNIRKIGYDGISANYGLLHLDMGHDNIGGGSNIHFRLLNSSDTYFEYGGMGAFIINNSSGNENGGLAFYTTYNGQYRQQRMTILNNGNVGIGKTNPNSPLSIGYNNGTNQLAFERSSGAESFFINISSTNSIIFKNTSGGGDYDFQTNIGGLGMKSAIFIEGANGNVGIGTTSPQEKLSVKDGQIYIGNSTVNKFESGRIRIGEYEHNSYQGAFIHYDGSANLLHLGVHNTNDIDVSNDYNALSIKRVNGYIGIGTPTPNEKLHIESGALQFRNLGSVNNVNILKIAELNSLDEFSIKGMFQGTGPDGNAIKFTSQWADNLLFLRGDGNIGIGTDNPKAKLSVDGMILATEIKVLAEISTYQHPDFVFEEDYELKEIEEVEKFIKENKHLPEIPSAKEIEANGVNLAEMNAKLLQKIEELTLYLIEHNKTIKEQNKRIASLEKEVGEMRK